MVPDFYLKALRLLMMKTAEKRLIPWKTNFLYDILTILAWKKSFVKIGFFRIFGIIRWAIFQHPEWARNILLGWIIETGPYSKHLCTWKLDWILFTLKYLTNKITLNDLKIAEHFLEENCVNIVDIFFD
jgi:hypothetical protein